MRSAPLIERTIDSVRESMIALVRPMAIAIGRKTALIVCDKERRILVAGHSAFAVTGYDEGDLIGQDVMERLGLGGFADGDPAARSLEWGVRVLNVPCTYRFNGSSDDLAATADFFPAYDDDGGLLVALTPKTAVPSQ